METGSGAKKGIRGGNVRSVPIRNGNRSWELRRCGISCVVRSVPIRNGNMPETGRFRGVDEVRSVPIRNGNSRTTS